ncbi:TSCPD domain-containing protein [Methylophilus medardicus]|uniref:ribonucleoside-diphosphate reductase n=1 Tax=Methylophilus medardicus TaxID=2588534 RepID=A0A5B8CPN0_9PROT|nr:NrdJb [Methylophilus medardicus]QDC43208.1 NrdJb [Methylophilus medardicus]QDC48215.1 NrdJb [Methylophilus medardicus]QDC51920.1 NrdJb [Methylophilus medardicus]
MAIKIDKKITAYKLVTDEDKKASEAAAQTASNVIQMGEPLGRPDMLVGNTYKIKTPVTEHALYITINDVIMNEGTPHEHRRPFEIFINSKNMEHFQWIVALTRVMSAVFRKGGDVTFLVEELKSVFEPSGGYFKKGGKFVPSLVAEIGEVVEKHLQEIGMLKKPGLDEHQQKLVEEKKAEYLEKHAKSGEESNDEGFPKGAQLCKKCNTKASILMDGCMTCLNCGDSKCG